MRQHPEPGESPPTTATCRPIRIPDGRPATPPRGQENAAGGLSWEGALASNWKRPPPRLRETEPAQPIAPFLGGKRLLARRIIARIEAVTTPYSTNVKVPRRVAEALVGK